MRTAILLGLAVLLLEGSAVAVRLHGSRRPASAARSREEGSITEMRTLLIVLLLAAPALADPTPGSWKVTEHSGRARGPVQVGTPSGNADRMLAAAGALSVDHDTIAHTCLFKSDQNGNASASSNCWFSLVFVGSSKATDHRWEITTKVRGTGYGIADSDWEASCWAESLSIVQFSGDNANAGVGTLAVHDGAEAVFSIGVPSGFIVTVSEGARQKGQDDYAVAIPRHTAGKGKACRVRVRTYVAAAAGARSTISSALASTWGSLYGDLKMVGKCRLPDGTAVEDTFSVWEPEVEAEPEQEVTEPTGGVEYKPGDIPTDKPTDEEREKGEVEEEAVDAKDLEGAPDETETPAEEEPGDTATPSGEGEEGDGGDVTTDPDGGDASDPPADDGETPK